MLAVRMVFYRRTLPHWLPEARILFLTWRLAGTLPGAIPTRPKSAQAGLPVPRNRGREFAALDRALDRAEVGPIWLRQAAVARLVVRCLRYGAEKLNFYQLYAFVVMPNHVHMLLKPKVPLARITRGIKGVSARLANKILGRTGRPFWQDESFDHWLREEAEFAKAVRYIERNPVRAGLVQHPHDWPWSSACRG
jgi:REP element-mobilizing transposase RayT